MTFGPGRQVWERFGHNAIWIHDPVDGTDQAYNYGLFDFHQENFLLRFVARADVVLDGRVSRPVDTCAQYERDNRSVWVQELELPPDAKVELERFLRWNARARAPLLPLRLLPGQLLDPGPRCRRSRPERRPAPPDRHRARGDDVPVPHPAAHRQRSAHLHRPPRRPRGKGWIGPFPPGRRCSCRSRCGTGSERSPCPGPVVPSCRSCARSAPSSSRRPPRHPRPRPRGWGGISRSGSPSGARPWCSPAGARTSALAALRVPDDHRRLGGGRGPGGTRPRRPVGAHRSRDGVPEREPVPAQPVRPAALAGRRCGPCGDPRCRWDGGVSPLRWRGCRCWDWCSSCCRGSIR